MRGDRFGAGDELVGHARAGGDDDNEFVALVARRLDAQGDVLDAFDVTDGGAAVFLDDSGHGGNCGERLVGD
jgi:hypothetical protein